MISSRQDLNQGPSNYEHNALITELREILYSQKDENDADTPNIKVPIQYRI